VSGIYRHIQTATQQGVLVIVVELGEVKDFLVAEELRFELVHAVQRAKATKIVMDLSRISFMTSLACVAFIGLKQSVRESKGRLVLCQMSEFIRKMFHAKRLLTPSLSTGSVAFEEAETLEDAIQLLTATPDGAAIDEA
jgi:anti-anti-sigma factor